MFARPVVITASLIVLAVIARLWRGRLFESLWYDEIATWRDYGSRSLLEIVTTWLDPANHVLHTALTGISMAIFTPALSDEVGLRLPAFLFSLATVPVMIALGRDARNERTGMLAGFCAAVLPVAVLSGVEARGYSMMIFFAACATLLMFRLLEDAVSPRKRANLLTAYVACVALGAWAHMLTAFVAVGHAAWLLPSKSWRGLTAVGLAAIGTLVLYAPIASQIVERATTIGRSSGDEPAIIGPEGLHAVLQLGGAWYWWAAIPGLALFIVGGFAAWRDRLARRVAALALLGFPVYIILVVVAGSWMYARFSLFVLPGAILLIAIGIDHLFARRRAIGIAAIAIIVLASFADLTVRPPKQPLRDAASWLRGRPDAANSVVVVGLLAQVFDAYGDSLAPAHSLRHGADLDNHLAREPRYVVVIYPDSVAQNRFELLEQRGYRLVQRFDGWVDWTNGDVFIYRQ